MSASLYSILIGYQSYYFWGRNTHYTTCHDVVPKRRFIPKVKKTRIRPAQPSSARIVPARIVYHYGEIIVRKTDNIVRKKTNNSQLFIVRLVAQIYFKRTILFAKRTIFYCSFQTILFDKRTIKYCSFQPILVEKRTINIDRYSQYWSKKGFF
jgi:hypothetical protein